jgi:hypothetical protein
MGHSPNYPRSPSLAAGRLRLGLRCERALAKLLHPDEQTRKSRKPSEGAFRLSNAIRVAIVDAHRLWEDRHLVIGGLGDILDNMPCPPELGDEEAARYHAVLNAYSEQFGCEPIRLHALADAKLTTAFGTEGVVTHTRVPLLFSADPDSIHSTSVELRLVVAGPRPAEPDLTAIQAQLLAIGATQARIVRLHALPGQADLIVQTLDRSHLQAFALQVGTATDSMIELLRHTIEFDTPDYDGEIPVEPTEGWWCSSCPFVRGCAKVADDPFQEFLGAYPTDAS